MASPQKLSAPVFFDFEASGLDGVPIEIGWASLDDDGTVKSEAHLIKPPSDWDIHNNWDENAALLHGIALDTLAQSGRSPFDIAQRMNDELAARELYSDSPFDKHWLNMLFDATPYEPQFIVREMSADTFVMQSGLALGLTRMAITQIASHIGAQRKRSHRAEDDARYWAQLWCAMYPTSK